MTWTLKKIKLFINIFTKINAYYIHKYTSDNKIDLIIIGSQRLNKFSKIKALGSVSRKISENADCPVMIIH